MLRSQSSELGRAGAPAATNRIVATYLLESPGDLERAVDVLAGEGSTGTFTAVPGEDASLRKRFGIRLEELEELEATDRPGLTGRDWNGQRQQYRRARVTVSVPLDLVGTDLTTFLACVAGNVFELREVSGLRLLDFSLPPAFLSAVPLPRYSISGTRLVLGVADRPLTGALMPAGVPPAAALEHLHRLLASGVDLVADGEIAANPRHWPLAERVDMIMRVLAAQSQPALFAFTITDDADRMLEHAALVARSGGACVQVSLQNTGITAVAALRRRVDVIIHARRAGHGLLTHCPSTGFDFCAWQKLWRLAGVDHMPVTGRVNDEAIAQCLLPLVNHRDRALPVVLESESTTTLSDSMTFVSVS